MMLTSKRSRFLACCVATLLLVPAISLLAAPQAGTYLEIESESGGETQVIELSMAPDRMRVDTQQGFSFVSIGGDDGRMLMIQHQEQQYIEFTAEMMEMMARMMPDMPQMENDAETDMTPPTFTRTGNTKQVGEWSAYEVLVEHPEQDGDTTMWFSQDVDADFQTMAQSLMESMSSLLDNPMLQMGGGGPGGSMSENIAQFRAQMSAVDFPDGFPVQIITDQGGSTTTNTLRAIDQNRSFGAETWQAPEGYTKVDMPFVR